MEKITSPWKGVKVDFNGIRWEEMDYGRGGTRTKSSRSANDNTLVLDLLGQIDLVTGGVFHEDVDVGKGVALLDEGRSGVVEEGALGEGAREGGSETAGGEHDGYKLERVYKMVKREEGFDGC